MAGPEDHEGEEKVSDQQDDHTETDTEPSVPNVLPIDLYERSPEVQAELLGKVVLDEVEAEEAEIAAAREKHPSNNPKLFKRPPKDQPPPHGV